MREETEIVPVAVEEKIITPIVSPEDAKKAMDAYQQLCAAVLIPWDKRIVTDGVITQESDYQRIPVRHKEKGKWITEYRDFPKKSAWRKLGKFYKISDEIIEKEKVDREDGSFIWRYTVKAIAPDGQYTYGVGSCDSKEISDERRREHFTESKAHTRAKNRATSDLIGFGQVSAEEVTGEPKYVEAQQVKPSEEKPKAKVGPPPRKTPSKKAAEKPKEETPKGPSRAREKIALKSLTPAGVMDYLRQNIPSLNREDLDITATEDAIEVYIKKQIDYRDQLNELCESVGGKWIFLEDPKKDSHWRILKQDEPQEEPPSEEPEPEEEAPPTGPPGTVDDVREKIAAFMPGHLELVVVSDRGDYYRVGRKIILDKEVYDQLDVIISEMGGEWVNEKNEWRILKGS